MLLRSLILILSLMIATAVPALAQGMSAEQAMIGEAIDKLSAATAPGGGGADEYAKVLSEDFSRWTVGAESLSSKQEWIDGIREWFDDGWRVSDRQVDILEIQIRGPVAFTRRVVTETYAGPDGEQSESTAALAEVWEKKKGRWLLFRVDVHPMTG